MGIFTRFFLDTLLYCPARRSSQDFVYSFCLRQHDGNIKKTEKAKMMFEHGLYG